MGKWGRVRSMNPLGALRPPTDCWPTHAIIWLILIGEPLDPHCDIIKGLFLQWSSRIQTWNISKLKKKSCYRNSLRLKKQNKYFTGQKEREQSKYMFINYPHKFTVLPQKYKKWVIGCQLKKIKNIRKHPYITRFCPDLVQDTGYLNFQSLSSIAAWLQSQFPLSIQGYKFMAFPISIIYFLFLLLVKSFSWLYVINANWEAMISNPSSTAKNKVFHA